MTRIPLIFLLSLTMHAHADIEAGLSTQEITNSFGISVLIMQVVNILIVFGLFALAARSILARGRGWEVPVWLLMAFFIPVVFPIIALIHFRKSRFTSENSAASPGQQ